MMAKSAAGLIAVLVMIGLGLMLVAQAAPFDGEYFDRISFDRVLVQPMPSIRGTWALVGEENATFVISRDSIYYPDHGVVYQYRLVSDSLHIRYDGFEGDYLVKMKGRDTLILLGDERSVYYRFKK